MPDQFRYWAFISYYHRDRRWAQWLHGRLERYRVPHRLVGQPLADGKIPRRLLPIFRDRDELPSSSDLGGVVQRALHESRYLIVLCSAGSAQSRWVNEEVRSFKRLGREDRIFCLRVDRMPHQAAYFVPALLERYDEQGMVCGAAAEPLAADIEADGREGAALKLIAGMLGIGYDDLRRRERSRRIRNNILAVAAGALLTLAGLSFWSWQQQEKHSALQAQALQADIDQLYHNGREELLAHNEARAAAYLGAAYRLGMDTPALRFMLARAMATVDAQGLRIDTGSPVWLADLSPDARHAFAVGTDQHLRAYRLSDQESQAAFELNLAPMKYYFAAFSGGGGLIWVDSSHDDAPHHRLRLFAADSGRMLGQYALSRHNAEVVVPPVADDDRHLAYIAPDRAVMLGEIGGRMHRLAGYYSAVRYCRGGGRLITALGSGAIELRDAQRADLPVLRVFTGLPAGAIQIDSSPGCAMLAAGDATGAVRIWDVASGALLMSSGHREELGDVHFSIDGSRLMTMTHAGINIWQSRSGTLIYADRFLDPSGGAPAAMRPDGQAVAQISEGHLFIVDPETGARLYSLDGHAGGVNILSFAADGEQAVSGGNDGALVVWRLPKAMLGQYAAGTGVGWAPPLSFSHDGRQYFVGGIEAGVYDSARRAPLLRLPADSPAALLAAFSADDRRLAFAYLDGGVDVRGLPDGALLHSWDSGQPPRRLTFDASGRYLAEPAQGQGVRLFDLQAGTELQPVPAQPGDAFAFSPRQDVLAFAAGDAVSLQQIGLRRTLWSTPLPLAAGRPPSALRFSPDGRRILVLARRRQAFVLDAASGSILHRLDEPSSAFFDFGSFSHDGGTVAIADRGKPVLVWHLQQDRHFLLSGHVAAVHAVAFSGDNRLLLSAGAEGRINIWDAGDGDLLYTFTAHNGEIPLGFAGFSPDGRYLYSGASDGVARLWDAAYETRDAARIALLLRCRVAWTVEGHRLRAHDIATDECRRNGSADAQLLRHPLIP